MVSLLVFIVVPCLVAVIISLIEAFLYNYYRIKPLDGAQSFKMKDFWESNCVTFIAFLITLALLAPHTRIIGTQLLPMTFIFLYVVVSFLVDRPLLEKKVEKSEQFIIPLVARIMVFLSLMVLLTKL